MEEAVVMVAGLAAAMVVAAILAGSRGMASRLMQEDGLSPSTRLEVISGSDVRRPLLV
jgi:hypothetical protein